MQDKLWKIHMVVVEKLIRMVSQKNYLERGRERESFSDDGHLVLG